MQIRIYTVANKPCYADIDPFIGHRAHTFLQGIYYKSLQAGMLNENKPRGHVVYLKNPSHEKVCAVAFFFDRISEDIVDSLSQLQFPVVAWASIGAYTFQST